jgi:hypothetical protein
MFQAEYDSTHIDLKELKYEHLNRENWIVVGFRQ